ncbi:hypothetical protein [Methylobacter luteus]|uniref:hypothetical protein n=1 Tax=Methylobacter luteus TaxID=415 RepID=UPI000415F71E|nr:hypothetical protein [Methylobacter luteus]
MKNNPVILLALFLNAPLALAADSSHPSSPALDASRADAPKEPLSFFLSSRGMGKENPEIIGGAGLLCDQLAVRY